MREKIAKEGAQPEQQPLAHWLGLRPTGLAVYAAAIATERFVMSDRMTAAEYRDGESLIKSIHALIEGHDPAVVAYAMVSVLAALAVAFAANPLGQARHSRR